MKITQEQYNRMIDALGKDVSDAIISGERLEVQPDVWGPKGGYWYVGTDGGVSSLKSRDGRRLHGSERRTREQAEHLSRRQRVFNCMDDYVQEHAHGWKGPIPGETGFYVKIMDGAAIVSVNNYSRSLTETYMPEWLADQFCRDYNAGRIKF